MRASRGDRVLAMVFVLGAVPGILVLLVDQLPGTPLIGLALLVPGAVVVAAERLSRGTGGPDIHDRELDRIVAGLAAVAAAALITVGVSSGSALLGSCLVLATPLCVIGGIALFHGTRRLWQQRAVPVLLFAAWPVPWDAVLRPVAASVDRAVLTAAVAALAGAVVVVLVVAPRRGSTGATASADIRPVDTELARATVGATSTPVGTTPIHARRRPAGGSLVELLPRRAARAALPDAVPMPWHAWAADEPTTVVLRLREDEAA